MDALKKLTKARSELLLKHPFFGSLALRLELKEDRACHGAWTDGNMIAYNPYYVEKTDLNILEGLLAHTVMHPACQHHRRRGTRDEKIWNMACDYAINWILLKAGFDLPEGYLDDEKYHGKKAEEIYTDLSSEFDQQGNPENAGDKDGSKDIDIDYEDGKAKGKESGEDSGNDDSESADDGESSESDGSMEFDSTDENDSRDSESLFDGIGEVRDSPHDSKGEGEDVDTDWQMALAQALNQARECGDLSGGVDRLADTILRPKIDWKQLLERFISNRARNDYSWTPPSRRHLHMGLYLPSLSAEMLPEIVLAVDTSGSISSEELNQFCSEFSSILSAYDTTLNVLWCDQDITLEQTFSRLDLPLNPTPLGGGGTDFKPPFNWIEAQDINPSCLIYFTDMQCNRFPESEPEYPVLWVKVGNEGYEPPFGEVISFSEL